MPSNEIFPPIVDGKRVSYSFPWDESNSYNTIIFESEYPGMEQRICWGTWKYKNFDIVFDAIDTNEASAILDFFDARKGNLESFKLYIPEHLRDGTVDASGYIQVRFAGSQDREEFTYKLERLRVTLVRVNETP